MIDNLNVDGASRRRQRRSAPETDVVAAGAGIVGTAAAVALAHAGFAVTLVEPRVPKPWSADAELDLRVVAVAPSSAALLAKLGMWGDVIAARAHPYRCMHVWDTAGGAIEFRADELHIRDLGWIVENRLLQDRLWQAAQAAGVRCLCPGKVIAVTSQADRVRVQLESGDSLEARFAVAADGAQSPLRHQAGIGTHGHGYGQRAVVAHLRTEFGHADTACQRFLADGPLALLPLGDGRSSLVWTLPEARAQEVLALDDADFCHAVGVASDFCLGRVMATSARAAFPLRLQLANRYAAGRLVLVGDAAHVVHPLAGQGVNLGLRDVAELVAVLGHAQGAGRDCTPALRRYARRRRSADTLDARAFDALARIFSWQGMAVSGVRAAGMSLLDRTGPIKDLLMRHAMGLPDGGDVVAPQQVRSTA